MRPRTSVLSGAVTTAVAGGVALSTMLSGHAAAGPPAGGSSSVAPTAGVTVRIATHNVWRGKAAFKPLGHVIGWQEMNTPAARKRLRQALPAYAHFFPKSNPARAVPISWRKDTYKLVRSGSVLTHKGEAKVTPNRYVNWALLEHRTTKKRFAMVNTHFISGAWSRHPERQARWKKHAKKLRKVVREQHTKRPDVPVFVVGDFNRSRALKLPADVRYIRVKGAKGVPIDQAYATRSVPTTKVHRLKKHGSDHFAYRFTATL